MCWAFNVCADILCQAMQPNMVSYGTLISSCAKGKYRRRAFDVYAEKLQLRGLLPNGITYNVAISACGKSQLPPHALHML